MTNSIPIPLLREMLSKHITLETLTALKNGVQVSPFRPKGVRAKTVYGLLIASIAFTSLGAITTGIELAYNEDTVLHQRGLLPYEARSLKVIRFASFIVLGVTCSLALSTLVKRDKSRAQLLTMLKDANTNLEEQVAKRTVELAEAIKAKDHFLGVATHDLKAPLSGIQGLVQLIRIENSNLHEREAEYLGHIEYSCKKMQGLINDILEVNRIEQGKAKLKHERIDLANLMNGLKINFVPEASRKGVQLTIREVDGNFESDVNSLTRILENLLSNAIKFSPSGKNVMLSVNLQSDFVRFIVADEGPGIPLEEQPRLFEKFQRLSNRPTNSETSTGLGLSIVKELTTQLGGVITFTSEVGKGTTFMVTFPKHQRAGSVSRIRRTAQTQDVTEVALF